MHARVPFEPVPLLAPHPTCSRAPGSYHAIMQMQIIAPSGRALWRYAAPAGGNATLVNVQACVRTNVLQEATLAIYEDDRLAWCATICLC